jgi:hypothetical protein
VNKADIANPDTFRDRYLNVLLTTLFTNLNGAAGDKVLERISLPIFKYPSSSPLSRGDKGGCEAKTSEAPKAFGAENEIKYSVSAGMEKNFMNNPGYI